MTLRLVRHGLPAIDRQRQAAEWDLDPAGFEDSWALRLFPAVRRILDVHGDEDVVLVGHGTAWTLLVAELTGREPDLQRWRSLAMPDVITLPSVLR